MARDVEITDLSHHGCKFFDRFSNLIANAYLTIRIGSIGPIEARVRWREGGHVGIQFVHPLHPSVLDHMRFSRDGHSHS